MRKLGGNWEIQGSRMVSPLSSPQDHWVWSVPHTGRKMLLTLMISGALHFTPNTTLPELSSAQLVMRALLQN